MSLRGSPRPWGVLLPYPVLTVTCPPAQGFPIFVLSRDTWTVVLVCNLARTEVGGVCRASWRGAAAECPQTEGAQCSAFLPPSGPSVGRSVLEASRVLDELYLKLAKSESGCSQSGQRSDVQEAAGAGTCDLTQEGPAPAHEPAASWGKGTWSTGSRCQRGGVCCRRLLSVWLRRPRDDSQQTAHSPADLWWASPHEETRLPLPAAATAVAGGLPAL